MKEKFFITEVYFLKLGNGNAQKMADALCDVNGEIVMFDSYEKAKEDISKFYFSGTYQIEKIFIKD